MPAQRPDHLAACLRLPVVAAQMPLTVQTGGDPS
jgi:hypothetical protein